MDFGIWSGICRRSGSLRASRLCFRSLRGLFSIGLLGKSWENGEFCDMIRVMVNKRGI